MPVEQVCKASREKQLDQERRRRKCRKCCSRDWIYSQAHLPIKSLFSICDDGTRASLVLPIFYRPALYPSYVASLIQSLLNRSYSSSIPLVSNFYCSARLLLHGKRNEHKNRRGLAHRPVGARNQMREGGKKKKKLMDRETLTLLDAMSLTERCVWIVSNWSRHQSSSSSVSTASRV